MERNGDNSAPFSNLAASQGIFHVRKATSIKLENSTKKSKLPTTSEYVISLFFHSSEGWYTRASTYAKMCIFMNMCFIKEWGRWKLSFAFSESFSLFQVLGNFFYHQSYLEKIVRHHFQFIVIRHRLSSNGKN